MPYSHPPYWLVVRLFDRFTFYLTESRISDYLWIFLRSCHGPQPQERGLRVQNLDMSLELVLGEERGVSFRIHVNMQSSFWLS